MSGCSTSSAQAYEDCGAPAQGLFAYPGPPFPSDVQSQYSIVALRNKPSGAPSGFSAVCEACLRSRGLIYWKTSPGDCPAPVAPSGFTSGQIVGLSGNAASGVIGGLGAVGAISGAATLGIGAAVSFAVSGLEELFTHHAQAVATEQQTICAVAGYFNPLLKQIDTAVSSGEISADQGVTYVKQVANQASSGLAGILKSCNAACVYQAILRAHADFAAYLYPRITPISMISASAPGSAPITPNNPPGAVPDSGASVPIRSTAGNTYAPSIPGSAPNLTANSLLPGSNAPDNLNAGYIQQTGQSAGLADVPPKGINWTVIAAIASVAVAFVTLLSFSNKAAA